MDKDRKAVCKVMSEMFDAVDNNGIYPTTIVYDEIERLIDEARVEAVGWAVADACIHLDTGEDYRQVEVPSILTRALRDLDS